MLANAKLQTIICTNRLDEARTFYTDVLGLSGREGADGSVVFDVGGSDLRISPVPSAKPSEHTVVGFSVPDVTQVVNTLSAQGVSFERFPGFPHGPNGVLTTPDGAHVAWLRDPDGNLLSIVQFA